MNPEPASSPEAHHDVTSRAFRAWRAQAQPALRPKRKTPATAPESFAGVYLSYLRTRRTCRTRPYGGQLAHLLLFFAPSLTSRSIVSGNGEMRETGPFAMSAVD